HRNRTYRHHHHHQHQRSFDRHLDFSLSEVSAKINTRSCKSLDPPTANAICGGQNSNKTKEKSPYDISIAG
ncbi:MAG: hypothetical protein AABO41_15575, partial [Acidobacteriota bacterium]